MKKFLLVLSIVLAGMFLVACQDETTNEDLEAAYNTLSGVIATPQAITENFNLPTELINDVSAAWESDQPGVISIGTSTDGIAIATVNRPAFGDDDADVVLTATLTLEGVKLDTLY